jgi:hypothetical protein
MWEFGLGLVIIIVNLLITVFTIKIDFFPSKLAYLCGLAFGIACAGFQLLAGRLANARLNLLPEEAHDRMRKLLATRSVLVLALIQLAVGTMAFAHAFSGLYVWTCGEKVTASYDITRVYWNYSRYKRCYNHDLDGLDSYTNAAFAPCLPMAFKAGSKLLFYGRASALGFKYDDFSGEIDGSPPPH